MCTTIVVGRNRSATGAVLLAHSEELGRNAAHRISLVPARDTAPGEKFGLYSSGEVDQAPHTARHVATRIFDLRHYPGDHTGGINEHGVAVANNMATARGVPQERALEAVPGGIIWTEFMQLVLERATSAREGVELIGRLSERHGLSCDSGTMIAVTDAGEAWWVELARGGAWAASRVADGEVSVRANCFRIPGFAEAYGDPANQADRYNLDRHDAVEARASAMSTVGVPELMELLRDVYEGTPWFRARPDGSPFRTGVRTIACMNTEACFVAEPRPGLPPGLAHRIWCCLSTSLSGVFVPFHVGVESVERHYATAGRGYSPESAYWLFTELAKLVDYRYPACSAFVRGTWRRFEAETYPALADVEAGCLDAADDRRAEILTRFDHDRAAEAVRALEALLAEVKTRAFYEDF